MPIAPSGTGGRLRGVGAFFGRHPILLLLALTPGIPEYLSGSSTLVYLGLFPGGTAVFFLFLGLNLGLYGPGVLLVREAWIRWGSSWGVLLLLGTAYGLLEEGTALSTLFNPNASVVGGLGHYGRAIGVNWVWLIGVIGVHVVLSVGIPIVLHGLALPATKGRPLLSRRGIRYAVGIYAADIAILVFIANYWRVEPEWIIGATLVAALLWLIAWRLPKGFLDPVRAEPGYSPRTCLWLGLAYFPVLLLIPVLGGEANLPAALTGLIDLFAATLLFVAVRRGVGRGRNAAQLTLLSLGATLPIAVFGLLAQLELPLVLGVDVVYALFFYTLWQRYKPQTGTNGSSSAVTS
jgi:hypothetical protein